jgi:integrase/recombinase XerC
LFLSGQGFNGNLEDVTSADIRLWVVDLFKEKRSSASVHRKISCLRVFYRYLRKQGVISKDPLDKVVLPKRRKVLPAFVEENAIGNLLDSDFGEGFPAARDRAIVEMLYLTGMRRAELI